MYIYTEHQHQSFFRIHTSVQGLEFTVSLKTEYGSQEFLLSAVGKEPIVPDLLKA